MKVIREVTDAWKNIVMNLDEGVFIKMTVKDLVEIIREQNATKEEGK